MKKLAKYPLLRYAIVFFAGLSVYLTLAYWLLDMGSWSPTL